MKSEAQPSRDVLFRLAEVLCVILVLFLFVWHMADDSSVCEKLHDALTAVLFSALIVYGTERWRRGDPAFPWILIAIAIPVVLGLLFLLLSLVFASALGRVF